MMEEHFHFNNVREGESPQYFNDVISRVSCPKWEVEDLSSELKQANLPPWREDWVELFNDFGIDCIKLHGREHTGKLFDSMDIVRRYAAGEQYVTSQFEQFLSVTNLSGKPIDAWRQKIKTCRFECWDCNYCDNVYNSKSQMQFSEITTHVVQAIAESGIPTIKLDIPGLTSRRVQTLLNKIAQGVSTYMEVGTAMGATFCAVLKDNPIRAVAIDKWGPIQPANDTFNLPTNCVETFIENVKKYQGDSLVNIINGDLFEADLTPYINLIQLWFYDGPHDKDTTKRAVEYYWPTLSDTCVMIFDDANWTEVVEGAHEGIASQGGTIEYQKLMLNEIEDRNAWWNGLYILVVRK